MKLFRNLGIVIALALGLMSCQQDEIGENNLNDGKGLCQINIGLQDLVMSRALSDQTTSAKGGLTNVDFAKYDLRYIIAIYDQEGNDLIVDPITKSTTSTLLLLSILDSLLIESIRLSLGRTS